MPIEPGQGERASETTAKPRRPGTLGRRVFSALLIGEGIGGAVCSLPLMPFGGVGVFGLVAASGACWLGLDLLQSKIKDRKMAAVWAVIVGALVAFPVLTLLVLGNCGFLGGGCAQNSEIAIFGIPALILLLNVACGWFIWRQPANAA